MLYIHLPFILYIFYFTLIYAYYINQILDNAQYEARPGFLPNADANGSTLLHVATANDEFAAVRFLLHKGFSYARQDSAGISPLHIAAERNIDMLQIFFEQNTNLFGPAINYADRNGNTAIHHACLVNNVDTARFLLDHGASHIVTNRLRWIPEQITNNMGLKILIHNMWSPTTPLLEDHSHADHAGYQSVGAHGHFGEWDS